MLDLFKRRRCRSPAWSAGGGSLWIALSAFLVSFQMPLAAYGVTLLPAAAYGGAWRLGVALCAGAAWGILCRGRPPPVAAFRDWRLWVGLLSFLDILLLSFAVRLADPLSALSVAQCSPLLFASALRKQLGLSMTDGWRGWARLALACLGAAVAVGAGREAGGDGWGFVAGLGLAGLAAAAMALNGFSFGWARRWGGGSRCLELGYACLSPALGSLAAALPALAVSGEASPAVFAVAGAGLLVGGGQALFLRLAWFAPQATLARGGVMPLGPALGALWLLLAGLTAASWLWVALGVGLAGGAAALSLLESKRP